jgi:chaperonin GroES
VPLDHPEKLPIQLLHDRVLVAPKSDGGDRHSSGGIVIPATAKVGKRLVWGEVVAAGGMVRAVQVGDRVLFDPEEKAEVELHAATYVLLRERDLHAVASERLGSDMTGLYL